MQATIVYSFETGQEANRFLNRLKAGAVGGVTARLYQGASTVAVSYSLGAQGTFAPAGGDLDALAESLGGRYLKEL